MSWHVRFPPHHCHGSDSPSLPAWSVLPSWLLHLASRLYLLMIRVTTHVYPRRTLWSSPRYRYPSCILHLSLSTSPSHLVWVWFCFLLSAFCLLIYCMAFRLEDTILALIRPPSCTIRLLSLVLVAFVFFALSSYPWSQIAMVDRPT